MSAEESATETLSLSGLRPNKGSRKVSRRVGRGNASGAGRTSGRGEKGQMSRAGQSIRPGFEGGQMPIYRRIKKFGFRSLVGIQGKNKFVTVDLDLLNAFDDGAVVDQESLAARGISTKHRKRAGIKVLGSGELSKKLTVKVQKVSAAAKAKIEAAGGSVEIEKVK